MKKIKYRLDINGYIDACGYFDKLPFEVDKDTPFQTIEDSVNWKKDGDEWIKYDPTWTFDFAIRVTIPETVILDSDIYIGLIAHVKSLISSGYAQMEIIGSNRVLYFNALQPEHRKLLESDSNVLIEDKE